MTTYKNAMESSQVRRALQTYFEFDDADLAANRLGAFSDKQKKAIQSDRSSGDKAWYIVGAVAIGVGLTILSFILAPFVSKTGADWVDVVTNLPALLIGLAFLGVGAYSLFSLFKDRAKPALHRVCEARGHVKLVQNGYVNYRFPRRRVPAYELHVAEKEFNVYPDLPKAMTQGDVYAVYYDSADETILSVEWIAGGMPSA